MTAVNDATLQTIWPIFLSFPYLPYPAVPLSLQEFIAFAGDDMGMQKEVPEVLNRLLHQTINAMLPPAQLLLRLCAGVQDSHVVTVIEDLKTNFLPDSQYKNTATTLRRLNESLNSYETLIPELDHEAPVALSLSDALERNRMLKARQRSRADMGGSRPVTGSSEASVSMSGALARQIADCLAAVQPVLDNLLKANSSAEQEAAVKMCLRARNALLTSCLVSSPSKGLASVPALIKLHALRHFIPKVIAAELLKETGLGDGDVLSALTAVLPTKMLPWFP